MFTCQHEQSIIQEILLHIRPNLLQLLVEQWLEWVGIFHKSGDIFAHIQILQHTGSNDTREIEHFLI
jgi:hypothetical protein